MKKISIMEAIEKCTSYSKVWEFIAEDNIDWSDLWIIDFQKLLPYESEVLYDLIDASDKIQELLLVLYARYGSYFQNVLRELASRALSLVDMTFIEVKFEKGHVIIDSFLIEDDDADIGDDLFAITNWEFSVPWMCDDCLKPYPTIEYREEITGLIMTSSYPTPVVRRVYCV